MNGFSVITGGILGCAIEKITEGLLYCSQVVESLGDIIMRDDDEVMALIMAFTYDRLNL